MDLVQIPEKFDDLNKKFDNEQIDIVKCYVNSLGLNTKSSIGCDKSSDGYDANQEDIYEDPEVISQSLRTQDGKLGRVIYMQLNMNRLNFCRLFEIIAYN